LATSAVAGLEVAKAQSHSQGVHGMFDSALLVGRDGRRLIIRVPNNQTAETEQSADLVALRALTVGIRSRLPFDVPQYVGQAPIDSTRAVVYELLPGDSFEADALIRHAGVAGSIGRAIAAIHGLPTTFVADAGLPQPSAEECRTSTIELIDRADRTGLVPEALVRRWEQATDDAALWQFAPTVIHGSLSSESFLISDDAVSGVLGWAELAVGDPARDLHWLLASGEEAAGTALAAYSGARQGSDQRIAGRALLYAELELVRWLLHGTDTRDEEIVNDAVAMLDSLVETVHRQTTRSLGPGEEPVLEVSDVEAMLAATPRDRVPHDSSAALQTDSFDRSQFDTGSYEIADLAGFVGGQPDGYGEFDDEPSDGGAPSEEDGDLGAFGRPEHEPHRQEPALTAEQENSDTSEYPTDAFDRAALRRAAQPMGEAL